MLENFHLLQQLRHFAVSPSLKNDGNVLKKRGKIRKEKKSRKSVSNLMKKQVLIFSWNIYIDGLYHNFIRIIMNG